MIYDKANRIETHFSHFDGRADYGYDARGQLGGVSVSPGATGTTGFVPENYQYDRNGNRTHVNGTVVNTSHDNQTSNTQQHSYEYDKEGNRTRKVEIATDHTTVYQWDHRNRLVKVTEYGSYHLDFSGVPKLKEVEYAYDAFDQRVWKKVIEYDEVSGLVVDERENAWIWDDGQIALEWGSHASGGLVLQHRYLYGPGTDMVLADEVVGGDVRWTLTDNLGSVRDVVDNAGNPLNHIVYNSFGNRVSETDGTVDTLLGFTGRDWDEDIELQYNRARWYDPVLGKWLNKDPIGFSAGDANLYRYVGNGVTTSTDPSGLQRHVRHNYNRMGSLPNGQNARNGGIQVNTPPTVNRSSGQMTGVGHNWNHFVESSRTQRANAMAPLLNARDAATRAAARRFSQEQLRQAIESAMRSGMKGHQIRSILSSMPNSSPNACLNAASGLNGMSALSQMTDALARDLGRRLGDRISQKHKTISVTAYMTPNGIRYRVHSSIISGRKGNHIPGRVQDRIRKLQEQGYPIEASQHHPIRNRERGVNPHAESYSANDPIPGWHPLAIGTNNPHCGNCARKMTAENVITASPGYKLGRGETVRAEFFRHDFIGPLPYGGLRMESPDSIMRDLPR